MKAPVLLALACLLSAAQTQDPVYDPLEQGYQALRSGDYSRAVELFHRAAESAPQRASIPKELGYLYLKLGEEERSREMFARALALDPGDHHAALELAFSYQRAGMHTQAAELFHSVQQSGNPALQRKAGDALGYLERGGQEPRTGGSRILHQAYAALRAKEYETAIELFQQAIAGFPQNAALRKELAYVYLKIGETEWAREMFEQALRVDPDDERAALELAFLSHETGRHGRAIQLFDRIRTSGDDGLRAVAEEAHARIDTELQQSIARWKEAVEMDPLNRSAQLELAELYEKNNEPARAVHHYLAAWLLPSEAGQEEILLRLARARQAAGDIQGANGAWLLASRCDEPRIAEAAKEKLPKRYPYASEFRRALELASQDTALRRDLAYLQLEVGNQEEARREFEIILEQDPSDLLSAAQLAFLYLERNHAAEAVSLLEKARQSPDPGLARRAEEILQQTQERQARPHRDLGDKSLKKSYLRDAQREFLRAYEINPQDYEAALKLGVVANLMKQDRQALRWFQIASASPDPAIAEQAQRSYNNLAPQFQRWTTTLWTFPFFSSRNRSAFQYSQLKTEARLGRAPVRPYVSLRFIGDLRQRTGGASPQFLSESSLIAGFGLRTPTVHGLTLWAEAGEAFSYLGDRPPGVPRAGPDYRGGVNWFRGKGATLGGGRAGAFGEISFDGVYISRFDDNVIAYTQSRSGYRLPARGRFRSQVYLNVNVTLDRNRAYWANFVEVGPGVRFRLSSGPRPVDFSINFLRGVHLVNDFNPRRPNYFDLRVGLWYSFAM